MRRGLAAWLTNWRFREHCRWQLLAVSAVVDDLLLIHVATEAGEWVNRLVFLPL